jgi:hypothetical protein
MNAELKVHVLNRDEFQRKLQQGSASENELSSGAQIVEAIPGLAAFWNGPSIPGLEVAQDPPFEFNVTVQATTTLRDLHCEVWSKMKLVPCMSIKLTITNPVNKTTLTTRLDENLSEHLSTKVMNSGLLSSELLLLVRAEECDHDVGLAANPSIQDNKSIGTTSSVAHPFSDGVSRSKNLMDLIVPPSALVTSDKPALFAGLKSPVASPSPNPIRTRAKATSSGEASQGTPKAAE